MGWRINVAGYVNYNLPCAQGMHGIYHAWFSQQWLSGMHNMYVVMTVCELHVSVCMKPSHHPSQRAATAEKRFFKPLHHETVAAARQWVVKSMYTYLWVCERVVLSIFLATKRMAEYILEALPARIWEKLVENSKSKLHYWATMAKLYNQATILESQGPRLLQHTTLSTTTTLEQDRGFESAPYPLGHAVCYLANW
eukprot:GHVS01078342.1.p1 GENE.GHVS01078342.1~~GHVS01078342.1.p1  ORF type:complete len:196 (-),score=10.56 GHVS01078342.1:251-838(-)